MTYEENVEQAIAANDILALHKFAYGYPCRCTKVRGEPLCVCDMQAKALREKIVPRALFEGKIQRVEASNSSKPEPKIVRRSILEFWKKTAS
jgi:hypothetical protein